MAHPLGGVRAAQVHVEAAVWPAEVGSEAEVAALLASVRERFGGLDVVFNHAACDRADEPHEGYTPFDELSLDAWRRTIDGGLAGAFVVAREAFRLMRAQSPQGGRIINAITTASSSGSAAHAAAIRAMSGLTHSVFVEGRGFRIACCQVDCTRFDASCEPAEGAEAREVADAVSYLAGLPPTANAVVQQLAVN